MNDNRRYRPAAFAAAVCCLVCLWPAFTMGAKEGRTGGPAMVWAAKNPVMNWQTFEQQYDALKSGNAEGQISLTGDLVVPDGYEFAESGHRITLLLNGYGIRVGGEAWMNNSNLVILTGGGPSDPPAIQVEGGNLCLNAGVIRSEGTGRMALRVQSGRLITGAGTKAAIWCAGDGSQRPEYAIRSEAADSLELIGVTVRTQGMKGAIWAAGPLSLTECRVQAVGAKAGEAVYSKAGKIKVIGGSVDPMPPGAQQGTKGVVGEVKKMPPCFITGSVRREDLTGRLPALAPVKVELPGGGVVERSLPVVWEMKNLPSVIDVGKAFVLNGSIPDAEVEGMQIVNTGKRKTSINVITSAQGPMTGLRGKAAVKTGLETEVELYFLCPNRPDGVFLEYSLDHQEWKAYGDVMRELTDPLTGAVRPEDIEDDGEVSFTCRLEILEEKAVQGFWVRLRVNGSEHEGYSNECFLEPKGRSGGHVSGAGRGGAVEGGEGASAVAAGQGGYEDTSDQTSESEESGPESAGESGESESVRKRRASGGPKGGGEEEPEETPESPSEDPTDGNGSAGGGYSAHGYSGGGGWYEEDEEEETSGKGHKPVILGSLGLAALAGVGIAVGVRRKRRKEEEDV